MDERIKILIEKRKKLGLTIRQLAERADLSYGEALHVEKNGIYNETYVSKLTKALNNALRIKRKESGIPELGNDQKWSLKHEECINCGTTKITHAGRGLCRSCYNFNNENQTKDHRRIRGIAGKKLTREYLVEEYLIKQKSLNDIAKECFCTRQFVYKKMREFKIPSRDQKTASALAYRKGKVIGTTIDEDGQKHTVIYQKKDVNEDFFSSWSNETVYVLGIIYSDGNVYQKGHYYKLSITQKEPELLNKIKFLMNCNAKLTFTKKRGVAGELYSLSVQNKKIYEDLIKLGLTPNKSLTTDFPNIPQEYVRHFVRGCWDGDGSVYIGTRSGSIRASFTSGSLNFIKGMLNELEKAGLKKRTIYTLKRKNPSYYFRFSGFSQCKDLYHYLYDDVPPEQYLERKCNVFKDYFEDRKKK